MSIFDKVKNAASAAATLAKDTANAAKEKVETAKAAAEEKKAAEEAHKLEMTSLAKTRADSIVDQVNANYRDDLDGFFNNKDKKDVFKYTKEFFSSILLPANSKDKSYITMYPYVTAKQSENLGKTFGINIPYDSILMLLTDTEGQQFLLTYDKFYFKKNLPEDPKFAITGAIQTEKVSMFSLKKEEGAYSFACDDVEVAKIKINAGKESDFVTLNRYFSDIKNSDYDITNEDIDKTIKEKLDCVVCTEIENECDSDELLMFFTFNSDGGYVACTTEKIIIADKQSHGNVSNFSRYYYDEIVKLETRQQATDLGPAVSSSLGGMLLEMAVQTAVESAMDSMLKDVCDLVLVSNVGSKVMNGMVKVEADRIVSIFNQFKKETRKAEKMEKQASMVQPNPVQQAAQPDVLEQIKKLSELKSAGILTEEEFAAKKADLLAKL